MESASNQEKARRKLLFFPLNLLGSIEPPSDEDDEDARPSPSGESFESLSMSSSSLPQSSSTLMETPPPTEGSAASEPLLQPDAQEIQEAPQAPGLTDWFRSWFS